MKDRSKKPISRRQFLISGSLLATATLAACAAPAAPAAPAATTAPAADAPAATEAPAAVEPTVDPALPTPEPTVAVNNYGTDANAVTIWHGLGGADGATFATMLGDYAKQFPDRGVRSELYNWDIFFQKFPTAVAAGTPPDVALYHAAEVPQMASQGITMAMDDMLAASSIPKDDFVKSVMDVVTVDGKVMAVPFDNHGWNCYVNTSLLEGTGFSAENMPKNGEEFIQFATKVTVDEAGKHPDESGFNADKTKVWALHFAWPRFTMPSTWFQYHGGKGGAYDSVANKAILNSEKSAAAVQYWHDLMYKHRVAPPALPGIPSPADLYKTNSLAVMWEGTWMLNYFKDNPDAQKVTKAITMNSLAPDGTGGQKIDSHILSTPTGVKQEGIERGSHLMKWLSDNGKTWATSGQIPARLSVQKDPAVQEIWSVKAAAEAFGKQGYTETPHKAFIELQTAWETAVSAALANTTPVAEALEQGNQAIQSILDRG
jgi:ABC-type glycerol-3-phosphate transport system substrate-binding protein